MSQLNQIKEILEREGKIDNFRAIHERITLRLSARIHDLKAQGWEFRVQEQSDHNTTYTVLTRPPATPQTLF